MAEAVILPLRKWRTLYEYRNELNEEDSQMLKLIIKVLNEMDSEERTILMKKYFYLKNNGKLNYFSRCYADATLAAEMGMNKNKYSSKRATAAWKFKQHYERYRGEMNV